MFKQSLITLAVLTSTSAFAGASIQSTNVPDRTRIVGGEESTPYSRNYQASIQGSSGEHFCGGSIIANDLVLTAAHCMEGVNATQPTIQVRVGAHSLTDKSGEAIKVASVYTNQDYPSLAKDVAILKLSKPISDKNAKPIQLADQAFFDKNIKTGTQMLVSGWGALNSNGSFPDKLMEVTVPYVTNEICNADSAYGGQVQDTELCAGFKQGGKDSCQGDSGGPLVVKHKGSMVQVGVVSWGDECAAADKYGVYANVAALRTWTDSAVAGNEPIAGLKEDAQNAGGDQDGEYGGDFDWDWDWGSSGDTDTDSNTGDQGSDEQNGDDQGDYADDFDWDFSGDDQSGNDQNDDDQSGNDQNDDDQNGDQQAGNYVDYSDWDFSGDDQSGNDQDTDNQGADQQGDYAQWDDAENNLDDNNFAEPSFLVFQESLSFSLNQQALEFVLDVPEGVNVLYIATQGGTGDLDIRAEYQTSSNSQKSNQQTVYQSEGDSSTELIMIKRPAAGEWNVSFSDFAAYQDVELTVFVH